MGITFRHDAAAVALPSVTAGSRKYGQQLVLQQQQQKYNAQQAGYDRMFQAGRDAQQQNFMAGRDQRQQEFIQSRDKAQNEFAMQQAEAQRQQAFMDEARKQSGRFIMDSIEAGEYDPQTARELRQNLIDEAEALGNPKLDATQRAEALAALRARRATLSANRQPKAPTPTRDEQLKTFLGESYSQYGSLPWVPDGKGGFSVSKEALGQQQKEMELQQKMRPKSFQEYYSENEDKFQKDLDATIQSMEKVDPKTGKVTTATPEQALEKMQKDYDFRQKALGRPQYGTPTDAPAMPGAAPSSAAPSFAPGSMLGDQASALGMNPSRSILEAPPKDYSAQNKVSELLGQRPVGPNAPAPVPRGAPPMPAAQAPTSPESRPPILKNGVKFEWDPIDGKYIESLNVPSSSQQPATQPQQVKVGGKPLAVTPGTLTPQETAARSQIMGMTREDRIKALLKYDPQMKGRTLEQVLEDPETKAQYAELSKQGLTTGNYREDIINHLDEMLQHNVLNGAGTPQDAYVGMRADEITDPKAKAEVAKMPRPKSMDDRNAIRPGQMYVDPEGVIRART